MDASERLLAIEEIKQLKSRYFRYMDTKDWVNLRTVFADDAVFDARASLSVDGKGEGGRAADSNDWVYEGGDVITQFIVGAVETSRTVHHGHCHEVDILSADTARGVIAMEDQIWDESGTVLTLHGCGHYHETYRRQDGQWRIQTSRISRLYVSLGDQPD
ncbi:nuclear transport factor 2 family protein [Novosphingobium mathurense]|uniref:SnoaL-like domain-containing protein n=1 Tax=Novosphingobium mathurense TaxID=428990 RepID=A0A1U6HWN5_9SPHN|nr:nuclear transport factor 2 family protein [Novosphingobium mathurense]SLK00081.1 SnoaL-like domain-containing protein [Novosphingobium mathurense]